MAKFLMVQDLEKKLGYEFQNIPLLYEALTQGFDDLKNPNWDLFFGNVVCKKRKLNRLETLGTSLLKVIATEFTIHKHFEASPGEMQGDDNVKTITNEILSRQVLASLGKELSLEKVIELKPDFKGSIESFYPSFIKAIFGAVFIDAGMFLPVKSPEPFLTTKKLFYHLWKSHHSDFSDTSNLNTIFYKPFVKRPEERFSSVAGSALKELEAILGFEFSEKRFICSVLFGVRVNGKINYSNNDTFKLLEYLGNAVYELAICTYLYWHYIGDDNGNVFNTNMIEWFTDQKFISGLAKGLSLQKYILKAPQLNITIHQLFKTIIATIYVDCEGSLPIIEDVIVKLCVQFQLMTIQSSRTKLPYSIKSYYGSTYHIGESPISPVQGFDEPPPRQIIIEIRNIKAFCEIENWRFRNEHHKQLLKLAEKMETSDQMERVTESQRICNQLEYGRVGIYRTATRVLWTKRDICEDNGTLWHQLHTYHEDQSYPFSRSFLPVIKSQQEQQQKWISNVERTFKILRLPVELCLKLHHAYLCLLVILAMTLVAVGFFIDLPEDILSQTFRW